MAVRTAGEAIVESSPRRKDGESLESAGVAERVLRKLDGLGALEEGTKVGTSGRRGLLANETGLEKSFFLFVAEDLEAAFLGSRGLVT